MSNYICSGNVRLIFGKQSVDSKNIVTGILLVQKLSFRFLGNVFLLSFATLIVSTQCTMYLNHATFRSVNV